MSVLEIWGIVRLTYRQAEGRRIQNAILCLTYLVALPVTLGLIWFCLKAHGTNAATALAAGSVAAALFTVYLRGRLVRKMYLLSASFLRTDRDGDIPVPDALALLSGELASLSAVWAVFAVMLSPAYLCLRRGIIYYSLSSDRKGFLLLLAASMLLAAGGAIFALVTSSRLYCAEYLWLSGNCAGMPSALDCSWELTRGSGGDILRLQFLSLFCGISVAALCRLNFSQKLLRQKGLPSAKELHLEITRDRYGEQHLEIV